MKRTKQLIIWGWMIMWGLAASATAAVDSTSMDRFIRGEKIRPKIRVSLSREGLECSEVQGNEGLGNKGEQEDEEMLYFFKAKEHIFKRRWTDARKGFEAYLKDYPQGRLRDEGLYWLAYSLNMLSQEAKGEEQIVGLKKGSVERLNELIEKHLQSLWRDDGLALRVEIAAQMVLLGREEFKSYIDEVVSGRGKSTQDLKIQALNALTKLDTAYVLPIFHRLLKSDPDPEIRKRAAVLLGLYFPVDAMPALGLAATNDQNKEVRQKIDRIVEKLVQQKIPVRLQYHVFGSLLMDDSQFGRFPENKVQVVSLPDLEPDDEESIMDAVRGVFNNKVSKPARSARGWIPFSTAFSLDSGMRIMNRAGDYHLWFPQENIKVSPKEIKGRVQFKHIESQKEQKWEFSVKENECKMAVLRSGDRLSLVVLQFREIEPALKKAVPIRTGSYESDLERFWSDLAGQFGQERRQTFHLKFSDLEGWEIHSSRDTWSAAELAGKGGKFDFGRAEAFSKDPAGWKILGQLLLVTNERRFIARKAMLITPQGKTVMGNEISVPADDPARYVVSGRKIEQKQTDLPDYGELEVASSFTLRPGVKLETAREYFVMEEFDSNLVNFHQSKAVLAEKGASARKKASYVLMGKVWTLLGDIIYIKDQGRLIGVRAILVDPDREIKAQGLIAVPIEDPSAFSVLRGKVWEKKQLLPSEQERQTRYYYPTLSTGVQGWEVYSTLHSNDYNNPVKQDFSLAQATRKYDGKEWILLGQILLLKKERHFIAREAVLINSLGEVVFGAELKVPTDNPSQYQVIK